MYSENTASIAFPAHVFMHILNLKKVVSV